MSIFSKSQKTILATEWIWLLIGTAAVYVHMMETWATPFVPMLWMLGVLVLFIGYRFAMTLRDYYAPKPALDVAADQSGPIRYDREGAKGMLSTTDWVPPHIRGRRRREMADAGGPGPIELPSASGKFDGAEIATVFAEVDDETDPLATQIVDLRPENEADITASEITIPSYAESTLSISEREYALRTLDRPMSEADETLERVRGVSGDGGGPDGADTTLARSSPASPAGDADETQELIAAGDDADKTLEREAE